MILPINGYFPRSTALKSKLEYLYSLTDVGNITMKGEVWGMVNGTAGLLGVFEKSIKGYDVGAITDAVANGEGGS